VDFLSSVRFGVSLLISLVVLSMIGMLIIQQNVQGFDSYYASLTPAEKSVFGSLGLFDIYHSWYFNFVLLILSLNIILASIDRFPSAWAYIIKPKLTATKDWLLNQATHATFIVNATDKDALAATIRSTICKNGYTTSVTDNTMTEYAVDENGKKDFDQKITREQTVIFSERGKYNRLGAYIIHVTLLTLFLGHFVALQTGFDADVRMIPGDKSDQIEMVEEQALIIHVKLLGDPPDYQYPPRSTQAPMNGFVSFAGWQTRSLVVRGRLYDRDRATATVARGTTREALSAAKQ
jgi:cytochrome c biogenesis protein